MVKKQLQILTLLVSVLICGCEVIPQDERLIPMTIQSAERTHVLVEYTGFRCVNCPEAEKTSSTLKQMYGDQLVVVAMHPKSNPFTQGNFDYTCPEADECYLMMGGTATTSFPTGNIDFVKNDGRYFIDHLEWTGKLQTAMHSTSAPHLHVAAVADKQSRDVELTIRATAPQPLDVRLAVWLTEDSIKGVQAMPDGKVNTAYYHRHVLRDALNDQPLGWEISIGPVEQNAAYHYSLPDGCEAEKCRFVTLLFDKNDSHILQAYETKLDFGNNVVAVHQRR